MSLGYNFIEMKDKIVIAENLSRSYEIGRVVAIDNVTLSITRGEFVAIVGPSGSGKSTLLYLLGGLERPSQGRVVLEGKEPGTASEWARLRVKLIGFVFQLYYLLPTLTALENVEIPMLGVVGNARQRSRRAMQLLERVGLAGRASHRPSQLSGGERQRVAIARSLANFPNLILADEPTGNLDSKSSSEIMSLFKDINRTERATIVLVTHDEEIASDASRVIRLLDGRLVADFRRKG